MIPTPAQLRVTVAAQSASSKQISTNALNESFGWRTSRLARSAPEMFRGALGTMPVRAAVALSVLQCKEPESLWESIILIL